jgi:general secretion pathway protein M
MTRPADKTAALKQALAPLKARWAALAPREQRLLLGAGVALLLLLVWLLAVQPAWRTLATAPAQRDALDAQLQQMQRLAAEAGQLRGAPPMSPEQSLSALAVATERLGDKARLSVQGDRVVLTLENVGTSALRDWSRPTSRVRARATAGP